MATTTTYSLEKPTVGGSENTWGGDWNNNADKIDDLLDGTLAIKPNLDEGLWEVGGVAVTATAAELNILDGVTASTAEINILDGVTADATEINLLDGVTALSGSDGVLVTGTAGTDGQVAQWNADGDVVGYTIPTAVQATWEAGTDTTDALVSPAKVKAAIDALATVYEDGEDATTSGTAHDFTSIPAGINHIDVIFNAVSLNGTDDVLIQLSTGATFATSGYVSTSATTISTGQSQNSSTSGMIVRSAVASNGIRGVMTLSRVPGANTWVSSHSVGVATDQGSQGGGTVTLGGVLDGLRLTRTGSNTFDAGGWSIRCRK